MVRSELGQIADSVLLDQQNSLRLARTNSRRPLVKIIVLSVFLDELNNVVVIFFHVLVHRFSAAAFHNLEFTIESLNVLNYKIIVLNKIIISLERSSFGFCSDEG